MRSRIMERVGVIWRHGLRPGSFIAFFFAFSCVVVAALARHVIGYGLFDQSTVVFATFFPAILIATLVAGAMAGAFALVAGGMYAWWAFMSPQYTLVFLTTDQAFSLAVYLLSGSLVLAAAESYRRLGHLYYEGEHSNKLVIDELNHRVKNKLATIQAILGYELRDNKDVWNVISGRLTAIAKADDLILKSEGRGAVLADILRVEFLPYGDAVLSRTECEGPATLLPSKLAVSLALILHELATNAAKYGSLSVPEGRVKVHWTVDRDRVEISWIESGGPTVSAPSREGFGSRLLRVALEPYHGHVERLFEAGGLKCNIAFTVQRNQPFTKAPNKTWPSSLATRFRNRKSMPR
jgi:two-component sensor histidine kinase